MLLRQYPRRINAMTTTTPVMASATFPAPRIAIK